MNKYIFVTKFTSKSVKLFHKQFLLLHENPHINLIPIFINSLGGDINHLFAMIDIIKASTKPVATIAMGCASSAAALLLAAGTKGYRFCAPNTELMIHDLSHTDSSKAIDIVANTQQLVYMRKRYFALLQQFSTMKEDIYKKLKVNGNVDWYLTPKQFKKLGFIDYIGLPTLMYTKES